MQNHYYDNTHALRPYTHSLTAMPNTVAPVNALRGKTPTSKPGFWPGEKDRKWIDFEDHRGEEGYVNGEPLIIKDFGSYPEGWSITPSPPTPEELRAKALARLAAIDIESARPMRVILTSTATDTDKEKLIALEKEAGVLRDKF